MLIALALPKEAMDARFLEQSLFKNAQGVEGITQIIRKQFFCVTDMYVCAIGELIPRQLMCVVGAFTENSFIGARITHKRIPARKPCVTDVLCNWEMNSQLI